MHIVSPQPSHIDGLVELSARFANESDWALEIPIGQITSRGVASDRLFGSDLLCALVAETDAGKVAGYVGVYQHPEVMYLSILVDAEHRRTGLGSVLVEAAFERLPGGLNVEAWVGEFNKASQAAMPRFGFEQDRLVTDRGQTVRAYVRRS